MLRYFIDAAASYYFDARISTTGFATPDSSIAKGEALVT
jgi:hypothetical protein